MVFLDILPESNDLSADKHWIVLENVLKLWKKKQSYFVLLETQYFQK